MKKKRLKSIEHLSDRNHDLYLMRKKHEEYNQNLLEQRLESEMEKKTKNSLKIR